MSNACDPYIYTYMNVNLYGHRTETAMTFGVLCSLFRMNADILETRNEFNLQLAAVLYYFEQQILQHFLFARK